MGILKFLLLVIRPISKFESAVGWLDVVNLVLLSAYPVSTQITPLSELLSRVDAIYYYTGIPLLLLLIAGIKLQLRLSGIENRYHYALSLGDFEVEWTETRIRLLIKISNAIDRPIVYKVLKNKTYIEIENMPRIALKASDSGLITAKGTSRGSLPEITPPKNFPCKGVLHSEIVYGSPGKFLFWQIRDWDLDIYITTENSQRVIHIEGHYNFREDEPIKKRDFDKEGSQP